MDGEKFLVKLSGSFGASGGEYKLHGLLEEYFGELVDEIKGDRMGNFCGIKRGSGRGGLKVMIAAHADEVALAVKNIDKRGFLHFVPVGGVDPKTLPGQEVIIHGERDIYGVIGIASYSEHPKKQGPDKAVENENMIIDAGCTYDQLSGVVLPGDFITIKAEAIRLLDDYVTGKAMDNRASICAMAECAKALKDMDTGSDIYYACTSKEEIGGLGAKVMSHDIAPDIAIVLDVTFADSWADEEIAGSCGSGVEISIGPNIHTGLAKKLIGIAEQFGVPHYIVAYPGSTGTDAWGTQTAREGIPSLLISVPIRYMHTSIETVEYRDIESAGKLLSLFISSIKRSDIYDA